MDRFGFLYCNKAHFTLKHTLVKMTIPLFAYVLYHSHFQFASRELFPCTIVTCMKWQVGPPSTRGDLSIRLTREKLQHLSKLLRLSHNNHHMRSSDINPQQINLLFSSCHGPGWHLSADASQCHCQSSRYHYHQPKRYSVSVSIQTSVKVSRPWDYCGIQRNSDSDSDLNLNFSHYTKVYPENSVSFSKSKLCH